MDTFNQIKLSFRIYFQHLMHHHTHMQNTTNRNVSSHLILTEKQSLETIESVNFKGFLGDN